VLVFNVLSGERGIRTPDTVSRIHTFQACSFNHSDTSPKMLWAAKIHKRPALQTFDYTGLYKTFVAMNLDLAYQAYWEKALPVETYLDDLLQAMPKDLEGMDRYLPINQQRVKRLLSRFQLNPEVEAACLNAPQGSKWLILNEHWCGDGAQSIPVQAAMQRASNGRLEIRVLFRDQNLELMDAHLTNGGRSIPMTLALTPDWAVGKTWGPRPAYAMDLVARIKANPDIAHTYSEELHKWYALNKQQAIQVELAQALLGL
jgi:hypothetical protein